MIILTCGMHKTKVENHAWQNHCLNQLVTCIYKDHVFHTANKHTSTVIDITNFPTVNVPIGVDSINPNW
jgi:hypothetical protein